MFPSNSRFEIVWSILGLRQLLRDFMVRFLGTCVGWIWLDGIQIGYLIIWPSVYVSVIPGAAETRRTRSLFLCVIENIENPGLTTSVTHLPRSEWSVVFLGFIRPQQNSITIILWFQRCVISLHPPRFMRVAIMILIWTIASTEALLLQQF